MTIPHAEPERPVSTAALRARLLERLVRCHSSSLGALLRRMGVPAADVDDVKQRVWLTTLRCSERLQLGKERAFLFTVARREAGHMRRSHRRRPEVGGIELDGLHGAAPLPDELVAQRERARQALAVLAAMDGDQRELLVALESCESTASDVARRFGIPLGTVKSRLRRARQECSRHARRLVCDDHPPRASLDARAAPAVDPQGRYPSSSVQVPSVRSGERLGGAMTNE